MIWISNFRGRDFGDLLEDSDVPRLQSPLPDIGYPARLEFRRRSLVEKLQCAEQVAFRMLQVDTTGAMTLTQLLAQFINRDRQMTVVRRSIAKQLLQPDLPGCGVHQVDTSYDVRDPLKVVIDHNGQLIGNQTVTAQDDKIARI